MQASADGLLTMMEAKGDVLNMVDLMYNWDSDCPGKAPGQGEEDFAISPNGTQLGMHHNSS